MKSRPNSSNHVELVARPTTSGRWAIWTALAWTRLRTGDLLLAYNLFKSDPGQGSFLEMKRDLDRVGMGPEWKTEEDANTAIACFNAYTSQKWAKKRAVRRKNT